MSDEDASKEDTGSKLQEQLTAKRGKRAGTRLSSLERMTAEAELILKGFAKHEDVPEGRRITRSCNRKFASMLPPPKKARDDDGDGMHREVNTTMEVAEQPEEVKKENVDQPQSLKNDVESRASEEKPKEEENKNDTNGGLAVLDGDNQQLNAAEHDNEKKEVGPVGVGDAGNVAVDVIAGQDNESTENLVTYDDVPADNNNVEHDVPAGDVNVEHDDFTQGEGDVPADNNNAGYEDVPAEDDIGQAGNDSVGYEEIPAYYDIATGQFNIPVDNNNAEYEDIPAEGDIEQAGNYSVGYEEIPADVIATGQFIIPEDNNNDGFYGLPGDDGYGVRVDVEGIGYGNVSANDNNDGPGYVDGSIVPPANDSVTD